MKHMTTATTDILTPTAYVFAALLSVLSVSSRAGESASSATPTPQLRVVGTLTDADGNPLPDAIACVIYRGPGYRTRVISQTTDKEGRYDLRLPSAPSGDITAVGWKAGYALGLAKREASSDRRLPAGATIELPMTLLRPTPVTLHVVDAEGASVTGGRIGVSALTFPDGSTPFYSKRIELDHLTRAIDANGQVTLDYLPEGYGAGVIVETPGNGTQGFSVGRNRVSDSATVKLLPVGTINVALVSNDPEDIRDRELVIQSRPQQRPRVTPDQPASVITPFRSVATVTTDDAGRATTIVSAGNVTTEVSSRPNARMFPEAMEPVTLAPGGVADVEIASSPVSQFAAGC
jgi:hypothetical protein